MAVTTSGTTSPTGATTTAGPEWSTIERLTRSLHARPTLSATLEAIMATALEVCPRMTAAGVNLFVHKRFEPQAVLGAQPPELDALQQRTGDGPCIEASAEQRLVLIEDTAAEARWDAFCARAAELGVGAMACAPLWVDEAHLGSLSLYASSPGPFGEDVVQTVSLLATNAALAIAGSRRADNLLVAVGSRDVIGQAKGILMERFRLSADDAFDLLVSSSQATRQKVTDVAEKLTTTGELPVPSAAS